MLKQLPKEQLGLPALHKLYKDFYSHPVLQSTCVYFLTLTVSLDQKCNFVINANVGLC